MAGLVPTICTHLFGLAAGQALEACPTRGDFESMRWIGLERDTMMGTLGQFGDRRLEKGGRYFLSV
jgi:hypothetical protein